MTEKEIFCPKCESPVNALLQRNAEKILRRLPVHCECGYELPIDEGSVSEMRRTVEKSIKDAIKRPGKTVKINLKL